jgi:hypothetical protein
MESINDIAIKLSVDAEGVSRGFRTAAEEARVFQKEVERLSYNVGKGDVKQFDAHVVAMQENRTAAIKAQNDVQEEANKIIRQHMTLNERYAQQLATLVRLNNTTLVATGKQALSDAQLGRAKTALTVATIRQQQAQVNVNATLANHARGYGGVAMAMGQASYAAEDFIQVLSMGGGLNAALMSASNNLSMVARALLGTSGGLAAVAGIGIPVALIGIGLLTRYLMSTEDAAEKAKKALEDFRKETENIGKMTDIRQKFQAESRDIQDMKTREEIESKITALKQEQKDLDEKMAQEEMKRAGANAAYFDELLGGQQARLDFLLQIEKSMNQGSEEQKQSARDLILLYGAARDAAIAGNEQNMLQSLREMHDLMTSMNQIGIQGIDVGFMDNFKALFNDPELLDQLQNIFNPNMTNLQENMKLQQEIAEALLSQDEHMTEERKRQLEIVKKLLEAQQQMMQVEANITRERQQRMKNDLEEIRMTDAQKELKKIRDQQAAFGGIDTTFVGPQLPVDEQQMMRDYMQEQLRLVQEEITQANKPVVQGAMEENGFSAQAQAFDQMLRAKFERDPQVEKLETLISIEREMLKAIENNAMVQVVK